MKHNCPETLAKVINGEYISGCSECIGHKQQIALYSNKFRRDRMKENHRGTLMQRYNGDKPNGDFIKLYPDKAKGVFNEEQMRRFS